MLGVSSRGVDGYVIAEVFADLCGREGGIVENQWCSTQGSVL